jgi:hypothetical protein
MTEEMPDAPTGGIHIPIGRTSIGLRFVGIMALLFIVSAGLLVLTRDTEAAHVAYCVTADGEASESLNVSLMQQRPDQPVRVLTGETKADGCGEFGTVPRGRPIMVVVWTDDGYGTGSTGWLDPDNVSGILSIQLESQASPLVD